MFKYLSTTLFFLSCFSLNGFANQIIETDKGCCIVESEHKCCIEKIAENKIYLKPTIVYVAKNGIFINVQGNLLAVNHLEMDQEGVYINKDRLINDYLQKLSEPDLEVRGIWGDTWKCPKEDCGYENYEGVDRCAICGTRKPRR